MQLCNYIFTLAKVDIIQILLLFITHNIYINRSVIHSKTNGTGNNKTTNINQKRRPYCSVEITHNFTFMLYSTLLSRYVFMERADKK